MAAAPLRLGTRGSILALAQAGTVADALGDAELVTILTSGDETNPARTREPRGSAAKFSDSGGGGDKSRFVLEIERALLDGEIELAVHSAKDVPAELPGGLEIAGVPARADARDAYIGEHTSLEDLPEGARVGTSSLRRRAQLLAARPDLDVREMRGNVDTRLRKLADGEFDGIVLAAAGLARLGRSDEVAFAFDEQEMTPAAGQGALAIEARSGDPAAGRAASLTDPAAAAALECERALVTGLDASCNTPVGVYATLDSRAIRASAFVGLPDGSEWIRDAVETTSDDPSSLTAARALGDALAERLLGAGASELLERAEAMAPEAAR